MPKRLVGVVMNKSRVRARRKSYRIEDKQFEKGDIITFAPEEGIAARPRKKQFRGGPAQMVGLRDWAPGRSGIVIEVGPDAASIIDLSSGENIGRDNPSDLKVGDEVTYDMMSDHFAVNLHRVGAPRY